MPSSSKPKSVAKPSNLKKSASLSTKQERVYLSENLLSFPVPSLFEMQINSYNDFLQKEVAPEKRRCFGIQQLFETIFPFSSNDGKFTLEFVDYSITRPTISPEEAKLRDKNYTISLRATIRLIIEETGEIKEQELFICEIPAITESGTFIINGAERVVVSQIHRSPGIIFDYDKRANMYHSRIIPNKGPWLEFELIKEVLYLRIDRKNRFPVTIFLRALGYEKNEAILGLFYEDEVVSLAELLTSTAKAEDEFFEKFLQERYLAKEIKTETGTVLAAAGTKLQKDILPKLKEHQVLSVVFIKKAALEKDEVLLNTIEKDPEEMSQVAACRYLYEQIRGAQASSDKNALLELLPHWQCLGCEKVVIGNALTSLRPFFEAPTECPNSECSLTPPVFQKVDKSLFFHASNYSLGAVGRYKINRKFGQKIDTELQTLRVEDFIENIRYLLQVKNSEAPVDDVDHLGNKRVRCVGEQLTNHLKQSFTRMERLAKDRFTLQDHSSPTPQSLISIKPINAGIVEFFGTSQLSQFMDQTNPLAAITHKRRISALGTGGLVRERAGFEVRDIHYTHYGRICPIETPEGPNIGLIVSLCCYAHVNEYGFIETPYYKIKNHTLSKTVEYLSAIEEDRYLCTPYAPSSLGKNSRKKELLASRSRGTYPMKRLEEVDYMEVASNQFISISASLIPFLEHDDANRALMGCNMMRQSVPLLYNEAPVVGTGLEKMVIKDSGFCAVAKQAGVVTKVDNSVIEITTAEGLVETHRLIKANRTNQDTFYNQRPSVVKGEEVKQGQVISDGPCISRGELALGKNVLVAFMTWEGYNYEDAILMSENLIKNDTYTSIHIQEFEIEARETKLGKEQITRDIPNISEQNFKDLDEEGIISVGVRVRPGSILVGKVTPKSHVEITPEYRLLYSIFGEKAKDVKDTSLRVPHGTEGTVIGIRRFKREERDDLRAGVIEKIKVLVAKKRRLREGDKFAGRHGNKGVVTRILPQEDMPFLADGTPVEVVLNPLGVPSRMNIGQVMETVLGMVSYATGEKFAVPVFSKVNYEVVKTHFKKVGLPADTRLTLYDGRTGEKFINPVTVGKMYYLKLAHLADDKIHARSTGPYSLVTQQPLGGKSQFGGQRVGEMEVWAIEAYGASNLLQEFLTVKSDAIEGRNKIYEAIVKGDFISTPGVPESFSVLIQELRGLGLNIEIFDQSDNLLHLIPQKKQENQKII